MGLIICNGGEMPNWTLNVKVDMGLTGLSAADACEAIREEMKHLARKLRSTDNQDSIVDEGVIFTKDNEEVGQWWKQ